MKITGVMVYYYFVCEKKLWYFIKNINMEQNSELVSMGKLIDESTYRREKKNILIDETINVDFLKDWKIIHEVKKSRKIDIASKWQLKYYIWILRGKGVDIKKGIIDYPLIRKREDVFLSQEDISELNIVLENIKYISSLKLPPLGHKKTICRKCAYYELCYI